MSFAKINPIKEIVNFLFGNFFSSSGFKIFLYIYIFQIKFIKCSFILSFYSYFIPRNKFLFTKILFPSCKAKDMFSSARHDGIVAIVFIAHVYFYMFLLLLKTLRYIQLYFIISKLDQNSLTISLIFIFLSLLQYSGFKEYYSES